MIDLFVYVVAKLLLLLTTADGRDSSGLKGQTHLALPLAAPEPQEALTDTWRAAKMNDPSLSLKFTLKSSIPACHWRAANQQAEN